MSDRLMFVVSNRGPLSWDRVDGEYVPRRGSGGLVSGLTPALENGGGHWVAAALSKDDVEATEAGLTGTSFPVTLLPIQPEVQHGHLDVISNSVLWFAHHDLWDRTREPIIDPALTQAWEHYVRVNQVFADHLISIIDEPTKTDILVQDYHLSLLPGMLRRAMPDLRIVHFSHTPFAPRSGLRVLPASWCRALTEEMSQADVCVFHARAWERRFLDATEEFAPQARPRTAVVPLGPDPEPLYELQADEKTQKWRSRFHDWLDGRRAIVRVDRSEPAKNIIRALDALALLLERSPERAREIAHIVLLNPSRSSLKSYRRYLADCMTRIDNLRERYGHDLIYLGTESNMPRAVAALEMADVLLVNPIIDGMNLVAKEGLLVNKNDAPLVLSRAAGAHDALQEFCISVHPYDIVETAKALEQALDMAPTERARRAVGGRRIAGNDPPAVWMERLLALS